MVSFLAGSVAFVGSVGGISGTTTGTKNFLSSSRISFPSASVSALEKALSNS
jgi:hypothetical protein